MTPELDAVLQKALSKDPAARFPTAAAFADALRAARGRRDEEFATELADEVWNDFNGDMPERLGLEPLQARDIAWRAATEGSEEHRPLRSTPPPTEAPTDTLVEPNYAQSASDNPTRIEAPPTTAAEKPPAGGGNRIQWIAIAGAAVAVGAAGYAVLATRKPPDSTSRFVVVEKETRDDPVAASAPAPEAPAAAALSPSPGTETSPVAAPASAAPAAADPVTGKPLRVAAAPDPAALSRTVQRQHGRMESCFVANVKEVAGRPEVSVRFHLAPTGRVESAELSPASISGTPLGQCLLGVMRSVDFGPLSEPVTFTIPITARSK